MGFRLCFTKNERKQTREIELYDELNTFNVKITFLQKTQKLFINGLTYIKNVKNLGGLEHFL